MLARRNIPTVIFMAVTVISAASLVIQTKNYVEFFVAVQRLDLALLNVTPAVGNEAANITLAFAIINPTGYGGLKMIEISYMLYVEQSTQPSNAIVAWNTVFFDKPTPINAYSNLTFQHTLSLDTNLDSTREFIQLYQDLHGDVEWLLNCGAMLTTFLNKMEVPLKATYIRSHCSKKSTLYI